MSGRNLYERVRAAYGLDEDDVLRDLSTGPSGHPASGPASGRGGYTHVRHNRPGNSAISPAGGLADSWSILNRAENTQGNSYGYGYGYAQSPGDLGRFANTHTPQPFDQRLAGQAEAAPAAVAAAAAAAAATAAAAAAPPIEVMPLKKVNSIHVPFDPEDQSDDEVIITTAYNRKLRSGEYAQPTMETPDQAPRASHSGSGGPQLTTKSVRLSPTATPFQPKSEGTGTGTGNAPAVAFAVSSPAQPPKPLVQIAAANGAQNDNAEVGQAYPGHRSSFCPWTLVANYHLLFVGRQNSERIKPYFETEALLQAQAWDFCYLWLPVTDQKKEDKEDGQHQATTQKPQEHVLLVPTSQLEHFLNRINQTLCIQLVIPPGPNGEKFRVIFGQQKTPIPRFLGRAANETALASIVQNMPAMGIRDSTDRMKPQAKKMYERKVAGLLVHPVKNKFEQKHFKAEKLFFKRKMERQIVGKQIKRVQRYLGLRQKHAATSQGQGQGQGQGQWQGQGRVQVQGQNQLVSPVLLDLTQPPPYEPEDDVIFVSMDIESYEYNHHALTEIGFGILDTRDIAGTPPGLQCEQWFKLIQARHIRIQENATMVNRSFVHGCEENFNFGTSEFVQLRDVLVTILPILQPRLPSGERRKVVLLGHDTKNDISLIAKVGFYVKNGMFLEILDTQDIHQHFRMRGQQMGLRGVLNDLEIEHSFLHNGGNDAVYTLQAMISLVVKKRQESLRRQNERLQPGFAADIEVLAQGWASGGEFSDGGYSEAARAGTYTGSWTENLQFGIPRLGNNLSAIALGDDDLISL